MENYLYGSARVRVLENGLIGGERLQRLTDAGSVARCAELLAEYGVDVKRSPKNDAFLREETLSERLRAAYGEVLGSAPDAKFAKLWLYPYDCNNIKAAIKCFKRGIDPRDMMFDFGTISVETVVKAVETHDFSILPEPFGTAAEETSAVFAQNGNPQDVDLFMDRVCYSAMLREAETSGNAFTLGLVRSKIDLINLLTCIRLLRMKSGEPGRMLLGNAFLTGGSLPLSTLTEYYAAGEAYLWGRLEYTPYASLGARAGVDASLTVIEREADNFWMREVKKAKMIPYGVETLVAYLIACEYEVRNLRIVLAGIGVGLSPATVAERIRESYV